LRNRCQELLPAGLFLQTRTKVRARDWHLRPNSEFIDQMKQRSMLHHETLALFDFFARRARHGILEIGAYIGGGSATIARALNDASSDVPFVTIEVGGSSPTQPYLPSDDIIADWTKTLSDHGLRERVHLVQGWSNLPETISAVRHILGPTGIDLFIFDADGEVDRNFIIYRDLLVPGCIIVLDDYVAREATDPSNKEELVQLWVDEAKRSGIVKEFGVFQWGTWFGLCNVHNGSRS
jgi:predicted O-methyltransferase YrrM